MGFFSNFFQSTVGKVITIAAAVAITAFTGGAAAGLFGLAEGAGGFIAAAAGLSGAGAAAVGLIGSLVGSALAVSALFGRSPADPTAGTNAPLQEILGTRALSGAQTSNSLPWVIGNAYISGQIFDTVLSTDQQTIWYAIAISEVASNQTYSFDLTKTYWGDKLITFDGIDQTKVASLTDNAGTVDTKIAGNLNMYFYTNGSASPQNTNQTAVQIMSDSAIPAANRWTSTNTMTSAAFVIVKIKYNQTAGVTGLVTPKFRLTSNAAYQKPGTIWYEYMTNTRFGLGFPGAQVDQVSANAWDSYADELITYTPAAGGTATQPRYRLNGVIDTKQKFRGNLDLIMANADGFFRFDELNNKWKVVPNRAGTSVFSFNDNNIVGAFTFSPKTLKDSYTSATISFPDASIRDQQNNVYLDVPNNLLTPNVPLNTLSLTYAFTTDSIQAQYLANRLLEQSQEDLIISFNASFNAAGVEAGDIVDVTNTTYGWAGKLFRVVEVREQQDDSFGLSVNFMCVEYNAAVYDNFSITQFTPAPNTNLADPNFFSTLTPPTTSNAMPNAAVPSFTLTGTIPTAGLANQLDFFYNTSNSSATAMLLQSLPNPSSTGYAPSSTISITVTGLSAATYYFFTRVKNSIGTSSFSNPSIAFTWNPQPASTTSGVSVNPNWNPGVVLVPANSAGQATTVGQTAALSIYLGTNLLAYTAAATDVAMPNSSWRVSSQSVSTGLTLTGPVAGATTATWTVSAMTVNSATLTASLRYKDAVGLVTSIGDTVQGFSEIVQAASGSTAFINQSPLIFNQNADGSFPTATSNMVFTITTGTTSITKTQPVSVNTSGNIVYGTVSGDASITVTTSGAGTKYGTVSFAQASSGIGLVGIVQSLLLSPVNTVYIIYRRSATTGPETKPAVPTGGVIDTATGTLSTVPTGWSASVPTGTNVLYQSQITQSWQKNTGNFTITDAWSSVQQSSQTLTSGAAYIFNQAGSAYKPVVTRVTVYAIQDASGVAPATPVGGLLTYFSPEIWALSPPSNGFNFLNPPNTSYNPTYSSYAVVTTVSDTQAYTPIWNFPNLIIQPAGQIANTYIARTGAQPATVPSPTATELFTVYKRNVPNFGDAVVVQYATGPTYVSFTYNGSTWTQAASFIKGDQVVSGTITASQIAAATITADRMNVSNLSAVSANLGAITSGSLTVGAAPAISGTTMTGTGAVINPTGTGTFAMGNASNNLTFDGTNVTINGSLVATGNIKANAVDATKMLIDGATIIRGVGNEAKVGTISSNQVSSSTTVTYSGTFTFNLINTQGFAVETVLFQWASQPGSGNSNNTINFNFTASNNSTTSFGFVGFQFKNFDTSIEPSGSQSFTIPKNGTINSTASFLFTANFSTTTAGYLTATLTGVSGTTITLSLNSALVTIVYNGITNPSPTTKTLVRPPSFNTYP